MVKILHPAKKVDNCHGINHLGLIIKTFCQSQIYIFFWRHTRFKTWDACLCVLLTGKLQFLDLLPAEHFVWRYVSWKQFLHLHTSTVFVSSVFTLVLTSIWEPQRGDSFLIQPLFCRQLCSSFVQLQRTSMRLKEARSKQQLKTHKNVIYNKNTSTKARTEGPCRTSATCPFSCVTLVWWERRYEN